MVSQTAWEALHLRARIQPGQTILIHVGSGGVGHLGVQLARLHRCRVITTAGRAESIAFCHDVLHADEVIDYRAEDVVKRVQALTRGLLRSHVRHRFALEGVAEDHRQVETARTIGKVAIIVQR